MASCLHVRGGFRCVCHCVTLWTVAHQAPLSMGFSRQEYRSGSPCLPPGGLPNPEIEPMSPALQADSFNHWEAHNDINHHHKSFRKWMLILGKGLTLKIHKLYKNKDQQTENYFIHQMPLVGGGMPWSQRRYLPKTRICSLKARGSSDW